MRTYQMTSCKLALLVLSCALFACSAESGDDDSQAAPGMQTQPLTCMAGAMKPCACLGQGMGMQQCNPTGNGYGMCMGCPPPMTTPPMAGSGPMAGSAPVAMV